MLDEEHHEHHRRGSGERLTGTTKDGALTLHVELQQHDGLITDERVEGGDGNLDDVFLGHSRVVGDGLVAHRKRELNTDAEEKMKRRGGVTRVGDRYRMDDHSSIAAEALVECARAIRGKARGRERSDPG